ncbi:MAG TPA: nickel pincer cofactor biosynthesis protein LarC [Terriglobales bacterium]|nr:nickel pincer cofactor biosynthesis protein LarC [Terriglobales bacterium]
MRIAYLDCFSGISGDMFLGALVDAGVPKQLLEQTVTALNIGARLEISRVKRNGISAIKVDVYSNGEKDLPREMHWEQQAEQSGHSRHDHEDSEHAHDHSHTHEGEPVALLEHNYALQDAATSRAGPFSPRHAKAGHTGSAEPAPHQHEHQHDHTHSHEHGRGLNEIRAIIGKAAISEGAKTTAIAIFEALGAAEAKIHDTNIEKIHFHEVGAVDAMVDIVCAAVGAEALSVDEIVCSPLNVGGGTVKCAHGTLPVPAPATLELLKDAPVYSSGVQSELVTPTGAAIVKTLAKHFAPFPRMKVEKTGYGAGTRDFAGHANVVRLTIGEAQPELSADIPQDTITVLEANIDDLNPQVFGYVMDRLLEEGALDVFGMPVQMKKNRPGMLLTVLCRAEDASKLTHLIFTETTTLGVRQREEKRLALAREWVTVATRWGDVRLKVASMNGMVTNYAPEYEDCRRIATERQVPLKSVMQEALQLYVNSQR